jgi:tetratricopeptide (TPR) repeat protein
VVRLHALEIGELLSVARSRVTRSLTAGECRAYLHQDERPPLAVALDSVVQGNKLARAGGLQGAIVAFREAARVDPNLGLDPEAEAGRLAAAAQLVRCPSLARAGQADRALELAREARELDPTLSPDLEAKLGRMAAPAVLEQGEAIAGQGQVREAIVAYEKAEQLDPALRISAATWNILCWYGSLWGQGEAVLYAGERAVELDPRPNYRDTRGVARAMAGDYAGAIEDFKAYVQWCKEREQDAEACAKREAWIAELEAGRNPFDAAALEELRSTEMS